MAVNQLLTTQLILQDGLIDLENNLCIVPRFRRDFDQEFGQKGNKVGDTLYVPKPQRFIGRSGSAYSAEGINNTVVPITINRQEGVDFEWSSAEKYLTIDSWRKKYGGPATINISTKLDQAAGLVAMQNAGNIVGTPGTTPGLSSSDAFLTYAQANQKLDEEGFPLAGQRRTMVITPAARVGWADFAKGQFNPAPAISKLWLKRQVSDWMDCAWFVDQTLPTQVIGALGGTPAVSGAGQTGTSINTSGWSNNITAALQIGDSITFAGVFAVNPQTRQSTGQLRDFAIQAVANSDGAGLSTLVIYPAIVPSGQYQNVTISPANGALISVYHTAAAGQSALSALSTPQQLLFDEDAFAFMSFPGPTPGGVDQGFQESNPKIGVSMRFVGNFDLARDMWPCRYDVYFGVSPLYPEGCCRIAA